ncbi:uncharacterized protein [Physcomitrium patens]|uniref:uncharacterized protein n=1 Tax=Physcomitrium patens TaxID=3218 RepID=UPI003CCD12D7
MKVTMEEGSDEGWQERAGWTVVVVSAAGEKVKRAELSAKRAVVGAGARMLFYPTLLYNVVRNKLESEFRWWDEIDEYVLLGYWMVHDMSDLFGWGWRMGIWMGV